METDTCSRQSRHAVLQELLIAFKMAKVLDAKQVAGMVIGATRKLNAAKDPTFKTTTKSILTLYNR